MSRFQSSLAIAIVGLVAPSCFAVSTLVVHQDVPGHCDTLAIPEFVAEIGLIGPFPPEYSLDHSFDGDTTLSPCPDFDDTSAGNVVVSIFNNTDQDFSDVWYVADEETRISNFDGLANASAPGLVPELMAFRIDNDASDPTGTHHPLIAESDAFDGVWQSGEVWTFILQDYFNGLGALPDAIDSVGVGSSSLDTVSISSGSIIVGAPIPEPTSGLLALGATCLALTVRRGRAAGLNFGASS